MGSKSSTTKQTNEPPAWAKPLLTKGASEGMRLYDEKKGYNTYTGPTQAQFSPTTLQGMNALLAATGGGAPITNEGVFNNPAIQQARQQLTQQAQQAAQQPQQTAGKGVWIQQQAGMKRIGSHGTGFEDVPNYYYVNSVTGERRDTNPNAKGGPLRRNSGGLW